MSRKTLSEYRLLYRNGTEKVFAAELLKDAAAENETEENRLSQITLVKADIEVKIPDVVVEVPFVSSVFPQAAADGGCRSTPTAYNLPSGTPVVFQALPAAGFDFTGWYKDDALLSTETIAQIAIAPPADGETESVYEARFTPIP
jgi:uncharacterized repeat protein (TIGR02543 family)